MIKCPLCGFRFSEGDAQSACKGCCFFKQCSLARCPNCSFETVPDAEGIKKIKDKKRRKNGPDRES